MRDITEMTHEEILSLTQDDLERMVRYKCAMEGVVFFDEPQAPDRPLVNLDDKVYQCGDIYSKDLGFLQSVQELLSANISKLVRLDYDWQLGSEYKSTFALQDYAVQQLSRVETIRCVSPEVYAAKKHELKIFKERQEAYNKSKAEWDKSERARAAIRDSIYDVFSEHQAEEREFKTHQKRFSEYLELADGNKDKAREFYLKAYPTIPDVIARRVWDDIPVSTVVTSS